ncbi:MAG: hypothetical protein CMG29_05625 [Candidatus Marinimicrobia bacterium]|nr:hypothetical protein [Candidatus Neomarinimicrobiota bacterium]
MNHLLNVFLEPRDVFTSLHERNDWKNSLLPFIITAIVGIASMIALGDLLVDVQIEQTEKYIMESSKIPEDQKEEILAESLSSIKDPSTGMIAFGYVTSALSTPVRILFVALVVMLIGNFFFGGKATYSNIMVMTAYTYMISVLEALVKIPLMISKWSMDIHTGLGLLGLGEKGSFLYNFMSGMDLFSLWRIIVLAVGMSVLYNRDIKPFAIALIIYWLLQTTILSFLGSLFT